MEEQILPIKKEEKENISILEEKKKIDNQVNNTDIIKELPEWNIEPPLEINRGEE